MSRFIVLCCLAFLFDAVLANNMRVILSNDGPAVRGSNITFVATVINYDDSALEYDFWDDAQPQHSFTYYGNTNVTTCTVEYPRELYEARSYTVTVSIKKKYWGIYYQVASNTTTLKLTDSLNGGLVLVQNNTQRPNNFVAVNNTVNHYIKLPDNEMHFLTSNASTIFTYWFIDCVYFDRTADFSLNYTYSDAMGSHYIDALVVANHEPLPPLPTTTTTTTSTTTTTTTTPKPPSTTKPKNNTVTTTTLKPGSTTKPNKNTITTTTPHPTTYSTMLGPKITNSTSNDSSQAHKLAKRALSNKTKLKNPTLPSDFICKNANVPIGDTFTYGHYQQTIGVKEPIVPRNITGNNWLQHGELLNLQVYFAGSPPFNYCAEYKRGIYNITGNETCKINTTTISNVFPLVHYFIDSDQHTVVVIIENDIGKVVSKATINIYKTSVHAQLSVIVVPVVFCLLAVILVVFGIAYYQHRSRHNIEVADFDFGQQSHFDYKTFRERLRDSFRNAFNFGRHEDTDPLTANTRYDSMT